MRKFLVQSEIFNLTHSTNFLYFREMLQESSIKGHCRLGRWNFTGGGLLLMCIYGMIKHFIPIIT